MFWIPIMFIAACVLLVRTLVHNSMEAAEKKRHDDWRRGYEGFCASVEPDRELEYSVRRKCEITDVRIQTVQDFMGEESDNWRKFALLKPEAARMILYAKQGKMESPALGFSSPTPISSPKYARYNIDPPWLSYEMTEKFLLRIEEELKKHGVEARPVANYGNGLHNFVYYPVRDYVEKYGYGREGHINLSTEFRWEPCLEHNVQPVP